ncbi:MAG: LLM class F420-dependent oxidoreductase [Mycobacterium sp.]
MRVGVVFPQTEIGGDPEGIRHFAEQVEALGFQHLLAFDHVLGADRSVHTDWDRAYDVDSPFHEPLTLFAYLAGVTTSLEFVSGVVILPQRQTVLVAKQAAQVDVLSGGRLRLGVGLGWNRVEYEALGEDFTNRGKRSEEQIELLRALWTQRSVTFDGRFHRVTGAGIAPLPVQRPIPLWVGPTSAEVGFRRAGRLADGWFAQVQPGPELDERRAIVAQAAREAGRDPDSLGFEGRVPWRGDRQQVVDDLDRWAEAGATHVSINTIGAGFETVDQHLAALSEVAPQSVA